VTQSQLDALAKLMWSVAARYDGRSQLPFFDRTPAQQAEKLGEIKDATNRLLKLMASLNHQTGQALQDHPYDVQMVFAIQRALAHLTAIGDVEKTDDNDDYPVEIIRSLERFGRAVDMAITEIKPKRGNSTNRDVTSKLKSEFTRALIHRYRLEVGDYPPTGSKGWAASLVNDIFVHFGWSSVGEESGSVWLRREIKRVKEGA
jgi:hypothetical protein